MNLLNYLEGNINQDNKILLYDMFSGIGDVLWRTALFKEIKRRNPNLKLYIASNGNYWKSILQNNTFVDKLVDRIGNPPYMDGVDYYISDQKCVHVISQYSREMDALDAIEKWTGLDIRNKSYVYEVTKEESEWSDKFLEKYKNKSKVIGIQLKSSTWIRTWPPDETIRLIRMLRYNGFTVIVIDNGHFGYKDDGILNLTGYNIREVAAIVQKLDILITPDSGILHFGAHFKIPTIALFGGSDPQCRTKYYPTVIPITKGNIICREWPCWIHSYACQFGIPAPCMSAIKAEEVFEVVKQMI